jgi:hypothetical protein
MFRINSYLCQELIDRHLKIICIFLIFVIVRLSIIMSRFFILLLGSLLMIRDRQKSYFFIEFYYYFNLKRNFVLIL